MLLNPGQCILIVITGVDYSLKFFIKFFFSFPILNYLGFNRLPDIVMQFKKAKYQFLFFK